MLEKLFGEAAIVKVLDFLLDEWELDFSKQMLQGRLELAGKPSTKYVGSLGNSD